MFYMKSNEKFAVAVAGFDDYERLTKEGILKIAESANNGCLKSKACLQRLVNSGELSEGNY